MGRQRRGEVVGIGTVVGWCSSSSSSTGSSS